VWNQHQEYLPGKNQNRFHRQDPKLSRKHTKPHKKSPYTCIHTTGGLVSHQTPPKRPWSPKLTFEPIEADRKRSSHQAQPSGVRPVDVALGSNEAIAQGGVFLSANTMDVIGWTSERFVRCKVHSAALPLAHAMSRNFLFLSGQSDNAGVTVRCVAHYPHRSPTPPLFHLLTSM
jgi:hypothetical protein